MYEKIIETGIILLLIYTPLAFGSVSQGSVALIEIVIGLLMLVWLAKLIAHRQPLCSRRHQALETDRKSYQLIFYTPSFFAPLALFALFICVQLIPFPTFLVTWLSPAAYRLYAEAARNIGDPTPAFLPLTVCTQATEMGLYQVLAYFALFLLIINNIRSPRQIRRIVFMIVAVGCFEAFYGLFEYFSGRHQIFWHHKQSSMTVSGTFVNKNHFAGYMEMVIPFMFSVLFSRLGETRRTTSKHIVRFLDEKYMKAILTMFLLCIMIFALLLSGSRGGIVSFIGGMVCLIILAHNRRFLKKKVILILFLFIFASGIAFFSGYEFLANRLTTFMHLETENSFQTRVQVWKDSFTLFENYVLLGAGLGTFSHIFPQYQSFPSEVTFFYAENDYIQVLAETGVLGGCLVFWISLKFIFTTLNAWKHRRSRWSIALTAGGLSAICSLLIHSCVDFNLHIPSNALLFCVIAGLSYVAAHSHRRSISE